MNEYQNRRALKVPCQKCGAVPGKRCFGNGGNAHSIRTKDAVPKPTRKEGPRNAYFLTIVGTIYAVRLNGIKYTPNLAIRIPTTKHYREAARAGFIPIYLPQGGDKLIPLQDAP